MDPNTFDHYDIYFQNDVERYMQGYEAYEQFLAMTNQQTGGSGSATKKKTTYIPREREEAEQRLIDDYFGEDDTPPKYTKNKDCMRRAIIGPIMKCTSAIRQLAYDTSPDAFDEYLQILLMNNVSFEKMNKAKDAAAADGGEEDRGLKKFLVNYQSVKL
ncbi:hypothetical protein Tco_0818703 [Tanacetum coccineum]